MRILRSYKHDENTIYNRSDDRFIALRIDWIYIVSNNLWQGDKMIIEVNAKLNRRIHNLMKVIDKAEDEDFKGIWKQKLSELLRKSKHNIILH